MKTMRNALLGAAVILGVAGVISFLGTSSPASPEELQSVTVVNFPEVQKIRGQVGVDGPVEIRQAGFARMTEIVVPPVGPQDTNRLVQGGVIVTEGRPGIVLSLAAQPLAAVLKAGRVGAILLPDDEIVQRALREQAAFQFPLEVTVSIPTGKEAPQMSKQPYFKVGFPRYRVLLYNTTDRTASVDLYAYLTN